MVCVAAQQCLDMPLLTSLDINNSFCQMIACMLLGAEPMLQRLHEGLHSRNSLKTCCQSLQASNVTKASTGFI